jgi:hypothetical protein
VVGHQNEVVGFGKFITLNFYAACKNKGLSPGSHYPMLKVLAKSEKSQPKPSHNGNISRHKYNNK